jgi:hypothetical protein
MQLLRAYPESPEALNDIYAQAKFTSSGVGFIVTCSF